MRQLSQDEIDAVIRTRRGKSAATPEQKAIAFDFQRPDRIPKSQLRAIRFLHENFARTLASSLSAYLRSYVSGHLVSLEQVPYATFLDGLPPNSCPVSLSISPYRDNAILDVSPSLMFPALELLLGGKQMTVLDRELTELEQYLLKSFFQLIVSNLEHTWKGVDNEVDFRVDPADTKRRLSRTIGPEEAVVVIAMEFRIDDCVGMINLVFPSITIKSMVQKFDQQISVTQAEPSDADKQQLLMMLKRAAITVEPRLDSKLTVDDLLALEIGSTVLLDHAADQPIVAFANDQVKFGGKVLCEPERSVFLIESVKEPD